MILKPSKFKGSMRLNGQRWKQSTIVRLLLFLALSAWFYLSIADQLISPTYDIQVGTVSDKVIRATKDMVDEAATEKAREQAVAKVERVYTSVPFETSRFIDQIFAKLEQINADQQFASNEKVQIYQDFFPVEYGLYVERALAAVGDNEPLYLEVEEQLTSQQYRIPEEVFYKFPRLSVEQIQEMEPVAKEIAGRLMNDQITNAEQVRDRVAEQVNASQLTSKDARELVQEIVRYVIVPNRFYDVLATEQAKQEAGENVQPIYINEDDVIVQRGEMITQEKYDILYEFDLLKDKVSYWPQLGLLIFSLLLAGMLFMYVRQSGLPISTNNVQLLMYVLIVALNLIGLKIVALAQSADTASIGYVAPVAMGSMLIAILIDVPLAFISSIIFSVLSSIILNLKPEENMFDFRFGLVALIVCFVSIFSIHRASQRATILRAGITVSLFAAITVGSLAMLTSQTAGVLPALGFTLASGIITAVLVIGLLPFFEVAFGILSSLKLVELSNPNHPLLRKLLTETPGTYHHSVMVGNLSEAAAEAIGANGLLCRVGSFYHDIGKTKRPSYFIENQGNMENPHDHIEPSLSKSIIVAHAKDGVEMLKEYKIPKQICDIAEQHHGTTLLKFFYHKAIKQAEESGASKESVKEQDFRYPGPKAQSKEAAIVGIADCVEAAVRSLRHPTTEQLDSMVRKIIKDRLDDNQFNECDLTLKELETVGQTLKETLLGIFHSRIEYPELPNKEDKGREA